MQDSEQVKTIDVYAAYFKETFDSIRIMLELPESEEKIKNLGDEGALKHLMRTALREILVTSWDNFSCFNNDYNQYFYR